MLREVYMNACKEYRSRHYFIAIVDIEIIHAHAHACNMNDTIALGMRFL